MIKAANVQCVPKNQTHVILNILYSCKSITMKFSTWCPDEWCIPYIICHLTLVIFLHYMTLQKNRNMALKSWSRGSLTLGIETVFLRASSTTPVANMHV